jgi:hypothetical protein
VFAYKSYTTGYAAVGTISGTSISFGALATWHTGGLEYANITFDSAANKIIIVYRDDSYSNRGTAIIGTVSGTTISFANKTVFNSATTNYPFITSDPNSKNNLISYQQKAVNFTIDKFIRNFLEKSNLLNIFSKILTYDSRSQLSFTNRTSPYWYSTYCTL